MTDTPTYEYVIYIEAGAERVWNALVDRDLTAKYWGHSNVSDWSVGSQWEHLRTDGSGIADVVGTVLEVDPPHRLVLTFASPVGGSDDESRVTFVIEPHGGIVRLTLRHEELASESDREAIAHGWPAVLSNLKTVLGTGASCSKLRGKCSPSCVRLRWRAARRVIPTWTHDPSPRRTCGGRRRHVASPSGSRRRSTTRPTASSPTMPSQSPCGFSGQRR